MKNRHLGFKILWISLLLCMAVSTLHPNSKAISQAFAALSDSSPSTAPAAAAASIDQTRIFAERKELFEQVGLVSGIPWYYFAAIDQYERSIGVTQKRPVQQGKLGIYISESDWAGTLNPDPGDRNLKSISWFHGLGRDGSGDGIADRSNELDLLAAVIARITKHGSTAEDLQIGLWDYYQNSRSVIRINQFARIYARFNTLDLHEHAFPLPLSSNYSYRSTWGASRGWGGHRIHEGTDLFAGYGVPVRSVCYGIIEVIGWNAYGGWRFGIRDLNGVYHYYAHLSGFNKNVAQGDIVKPGQLLGWVGSSGYGKPGTSGKFPPHLHFGLYRDYGLSEWSFDPYSYLRKWERKERSRSKNKRP